MINMTGMLTAQLEWYAEMKPRGQRKGRMNFGTWVTAPTKESAKSEALKEAELNGFHDYQIASIKEVR